LCRREPSYNSYSRRDERRGGGGGGRGGASGGRGGASPERAPTFYDQLDGPVREGGGSAVPDLQADFPSLGSQQTFHTSSAKVSNIFNRAAPDTDLPRICSQAKNADACTPARFSTRLIFQSQISVTGTGTFRNIKIPVPF
jgi:hypothetical protein